MSFLLICSPASLTFALFHVLFSVRSVLEILLRIAFLPHTFIWHRT